MVSLAPQERFITFRVVGRIDGTTASLVGFDRVRIGPNGQILLTQGQDRQILVFDSSGSRVRVIGHPGDGPGEFRRLNNAGWLGDRVWALDDAHNLLTFFSGSGAYERSIRLTETVWLGSQRFDSTQSMTGLRLATAVVSDNAILRLGGPHARSAGEARSRCASGQCVLLVDSTNTLLRVVAQIPRDSLGVSLTVGRGATQSARAPFAHQSIWAASADGAVIAIASTRFVGRSEQTYRVTALGLANDTLFDRTLMYAGELVTARAADSAIAQMLATLRRVNAGGALIRAYEANVRSMIPQWRQPYVRLLVGRDRTVWIQLRSQPAQGQRWRALSSSGAARGTLALPPRMELLECDGDRAWAVQLDENDVPSLVMLRLSIP
jgi:hypothetical protein